MNKLHFYILPILLLVCSCDKSLIQTKNYVGSSKDILFRHVGKPHMSLYNGEKGEILIYIVNKKREVITEPNLGSEKEFVYDRNIWNYVVFLVDTDDIVYHTAKQFYRVPPPYMKRMMLEKYG